MKGLLTLLISIRNDTTVFIELSTDTTLGLFTWPLPKNLLIHIIGNYYNIKNLLFQLVYVSCELVV